MKFAYQRALILAALFYLVAGILLGLCMYLARAVPELSWALRFRTVHVHLLVAGFILQLIMGVALWMFPRHKNPPHYTSPRSGMFLVILYNSGIWLRSIAEPFAGRGATPLFWLAFGGMLLQTAGIFFFLYLIVRRVRAP